MPTIPSGYLPARDAAIALAKARAPDAAVDEYLARPTEADRWHAYAVRPVRRTVYDPAPTYQGFLPQQFCVWEPPPQWLRAFQVLETARDQIVQWWADSALPIVGLGSDGQLRELPPELGRTEAARLAMLSGAIRYHGAVWTVLIAAAALAQCVRGDEPPVIKAAVPAEPEPRIEQAEAERPQAPQKLKAAPLRVIDQALHEVQDAAGDKPLNQATIATPARKWLIDHGWTASHKQIKERAKELQHANRRRKSGKPGPSA